MTGDAFVELARKMLVFQPTSGPAGTRSVVSRAYYGVFHAVRHFIETQLGFERQKSVDGDNPHRFVQVYLSESSEPNAVELSSLMKTLHELRKFADYDIGEEKYETQRFASDSITRADRILRTLEKCTQEPSRTHIKEGMSSYRQKISSAGRRAVQ